jgi:N-acetylmuramoyl-L-alanine amidase
VVLDIALMVGKKIKEKYPKVTVVYTRKTDEFIGLNDRAKKANQINADLFVSIHADAAGNPQAHGTETFALGLHRSKENLETAKRENKVILMEDNYKVSYEGFDPNSDESYIGLGLLQQGSLAQSLSMAAKVQEQFTAIGRRDRGVKQAGFLVLVKTTMPSVLVETGFITNTDEGRFLNKSENRVTIANCIFNAFSEYKTDVDREFAPKTEETTKKETPVTNDSGVRFRVQIVSCPKPLEIVPKNFKGLTDVRELQAGGMYKYTIGNELTFEDGVSLQKEVRKKGYEDAFLIGVYNNKRISVSEANKIINSKSK